MSAAILTQGLRKVYPAPSTRGRRGAGPGAGSPPGGAPGTGARPTGPGRDDAKAAPGATDGIVALVGLDLEIRDGEFFGLLGPNGAGKTTTIGILTTRVIATAGRAVVAGADVGAEAVTVRQRIGVVPQRPNPDRSLSVLENLVFHAAYFGIPHARATAVAHALLERFEIDARADAKVEELSGGQQQRLMIARALIHEPRVIFLDEPTVGLDPQARRSLWDILRELHAQGRTIVMTTHYMEEADRLCERLAIVDEGRLLALDTPASLRTRAPGGTLVELTLDGDATPIVATARALPHVTDVSARDGVLRVYSDRGGQIIPALIDLVQSGGRTVNNINLAAPSLETLFLALTGKKLD